MIAFSTSPARGVLDFARHPRWWGWPLAMILVAWAGLIAVFVAVLLAMKPGETVGVLATLTGWAWAFGSALATSVALWMTLQPILLGFAFERLARQVQQEANATPTPEEPLWRAVLSSLRVLVNTLPLRLGTVLLALVAPFLGGPLGIVAATAAVSYVALIDAHDIALSVRGVDGLHRLIALRAHRDETLRSVPVATGLSLVLGLTVVGWVLWLPGLVVAAARTVLAWPEVAPPAHVATGD